MKKTVRILLITILVIIAVFVGYKFGDNNNKSMETPAHSIEVDKNAQETSDLREDEIFYLNDMSAEESSQYIRGKVFQGYSYRMAAGIGEVLFFTPESNEYFWFCSSMDRQSRIRAEYGTWTLEDGFLSTTTLKIIEWVDGHFDTAYGSTASRYELADYIEVLTEVDIESWTNFRMFKFLPYDQESSSEEMGFYYQGKAYYYVTLLDEMEALYDSYFSLFGYSIPNR